MTFNTSTLQICVWGESLTKKTPQKTFLVNFPPIQLLTFKQINHLLMIIIIYSLSFNT